MTRRSFMAMLGAALAAVGVRAKLGPVAGWLAAAGPEVTAAEPTKAPTRWIGHC